nr:hypothetical protein [uncultured Undibacterium sp.]
MGRLTFLLVLNDASFGTANPAQHDGRLGIAENDRWLYLFFGGGDPVTSTLE